MDFHFRTCNLPSLLPPHGSEQPIRLIRQVHQIRKSQLLIVAMKFAGSIGISSFVCTSITKRGQLPSHKN